MEILGYFLVMLMGMTLGLIGAGGSILTIPILLYIFKVPLAIATHNSLVLVGTSAGVGALKFRQDIDLKQALSFALPSFFGVYAARHFIVPHFPPAMIGIPLDTLLMFLLILLMLIAGTLMMRPLTLNRQQAHRHPWMTVALSSLMGINVGFLMGILGTGGGFIIIPTLVLFLGFEMTKAIATSLMIISFNAGIGVLSDPMPLEREMLEHLGIAITLALLGMFLGFAVIRRFPTLDLRRLFGAFVIALATVMAIVELRTL